ncbi:hypothetical protein EV652_102180 [Kribbella steppae]|uniref:Uncharacterized protein n=1 Tax=Kribbella steppae TaxID=2512223 RepID=A0A4R2HVQ5_9ACTN|nr:hypothetical protein [Kribbella steppae]TCO34115.1 hypothetical protein EV652_102180 [Kribbella steppae]
MSSIVPGPQKKLEEEITAARAGAKPLNAGDLNPSAPKQEQLVGLDDWPPTVRTVVEADHDRVAALVSNRRRTADHSVPEVVRGLDELLDQIAERLQADKPRLLRKPTAAATEVELDDVAELLGIPPDELAAAPGRAERRTALRTIKQLRGELKELETSHDHSRLTRLVTFVVRLALVIDGVPETAGALAPIALDRYANAVPDVQWDWTFQQKLEFWQETHKTLAARSSS